MLGEDHEIAVEVCDLLAPAWIKVSRFREARALSQLTLTLGSDYRVLHSLAMAEQVLGNVTNASAHFDAAIAAIPDLDNASEDDIADTAALLHDRAAFAAEQGDNTQALDLFQRSMALNERIGHAGGKVPTLTHMAAIAEGQGDISKAVDLYQQSLELAEQLGDIRGSSSALHQLAGVAFQQGDLSRAADLYEQSLDLEEQIGEVRGKAATLHQMAAIAGEQGDLSRALHLYEQSLDLEQRIGNTRGGAATILQMAGIAVRQGDLTRGLDLCEQSLELHEQTGDIHGKAIALANIAFIRHEQGDPDAAEAANRDAAILLAQAQAWPDLAGVLGNMRGDRNARYLAQGAWLAIRVDAPIQQTIPSLAALLGAVGPASATAPFIATAAAFLAGRLTADHARYEEMRRLGAGMMGACADARGINTDDALRDWIERERLNDPTHFLPALEAAVVELAGDTWLFDRDLVMARDSSEAAADGDVN